MAAQIKYNYFKDKDTFRREFVREVESTYAIDFKNLSIYYPYFKKKKLKLKGKDYL